MSGRRSSIAPRRDGGSATESWDENKELLERAKRILNERRRRTHYFTRAMFGEPAWDLLLALYIGEQHGLAQTLNDLVRFSDLTTAAAQRWLAVLRDEGMLLSQADPNDPAGVQLTGKARLALDSYLAGMTA